MKTKKYTKLEKMVIAEIGEEAIKFFDNPGKYRDQAYNGLHEASSIDEANRALNSYFVANYIRAYNRVTDNFSTYVSMLIKSVYKILVRYANNNEYVKIALDSAIEKYGMSDGLEEGYTYVISKS